MRGTEREKLSAGTERAAFRPVPGFDGKKAGHMGRKWKIKDLGCGGKRVGDSPFTLGRKGLFLEKATERYMQNNERMFINKMQFVEIKFEA